MTDSDATRARRHSYENDGIRRYSGQTSIPDMTVQPAIEPSVPR